MDFDFDKAAANPWLAQRHRLGDQPQVHARQSWGERALNAIITGSGRRRWRRAGGSPGRDQRQKARPGVVLLTSAFCTVILRSSWSALQRPTGARYAGRQGARRLRHRQREAER